MQPNISVITEDIYLKLSVGEVILHFFTKLCPFFDLEFSKCSFSRALAHACGAVVYINSPATHSQFSLSASWERLIVAAHPDKNLQFVYISIRKRIILCSPI